MGVLRRENRMLSLDEEEFVRSVTDGIPATPPNFAMIIEHNQSGRKLEVDPTFLEAGANRCAVG